MRRSCGFTGLLNPPWCRAALLVLFAFATHFADAQEMQVDKGPGQAEVEGVGSSNAESGHSFVVLPIPLVNPALGSGLVLAGVAFYQPEGSARPWMTGAGALWTDNGSRGIGLFQKAYLGGDRYRLTAAVGRADLDLDFYGVGDAAADRDVSIGINQEPEFARFDLLRRIAAGNYLGLRLRAVDVKTRVPVSLPPFPDLQIPDRELNVDLVGPGLIYEFDTRDSETYPTRGFYVTATSQWNLAGWGSDLQYAKLNASINHYGRVRPNAILALRGSICQAGSDAPFFDLCLFGANNDLRGYETGQFRDYSMFAAQAEYRWQFAERWGAVFFAGVGAVAPSFSEFDSSGLLPSGGAGLRFKASTKFNVNVRMDYAVGKNSDALYFSIGEAF
ncbi:BamA/TamA family outer membrane protein [Dokdonella sp.]|uniref:BamA/TamA family outer membrane protein n=1 Tax=Dokdonella sp. TaxID=2291710 RepID=UPI0035289DE3